MMGVSRPAPRSTHPTAETETRSAAHPYHPAQVKTARTTQQEPDRGDPAVSLGSTATAHRSAADRCRRPDQTGASHEGYLARPDIGPVYPHRARPSTAARHRWLGRGGAEWRSGGGGRL